MLSFSDIRDTRRNHVRWYKFDCDIPGKKDLLVIKIKMLNQQCRYMSFEFWVDVGSKDMHFGVININLVFKATDLNLR